MENTSQPDSLDSPPIWVSSAGPLPKHILKIYNEFHWPQYRELVLQAATSAERLTGQSLAHLSWLETIGQAELAKFLFAKEKECQENLQLPLDRRLALVMAKVKLLQSWHRTRKILDDSDD